MGATRATPGGSASAVRPTTYLRKASGVVKAFSTFDAFAYNSIANSPAVAGAMAFMLMSIAFPNGNPAVSMLITVVFLAFACVTYALLQSAMPRTGGDYVFESRLLSGSVGFILTFAAYVFLTGLWLAMNGWMFCNIIFGPFLIVLGSYWNIPAMKDLATWLISPAGIFWGNVFIICWIVTMCSIGFTTYAKIQRWFFWGGVATFAVMLAVMALNSQESFISNFNGVMAQYFGASDAYNTTIANAKAAGFVPGQGFNLGDTIALVPGAFFVIMWAIWSSGNAGEIRDAGTVRPKLIQTLGSLALSGGLVATIYYLLGRFGSEFLGSAAYLYYNAPDKTVLPVPPFFGFFLATLSNNTILVLLIFLCFFFFWWMALPNAVIYGSRVVLAMSLDRAVPAWLGRVNSRTHTPLNAVLVLGLLGVLFGGLYAFTDWFWKLTLSGSLLTLISFGATCLGAAIWPYVKPELYKASPISRFKVAGIPAVTVFGLIFDVIALYVLWQYVTVSTWGIAATTGYIFNFVMLAIGAITYFSFKFYRKRKESLDLSLIYKEIPPE